MTGPDWITGPSIGLAAPWVIDQVFLFDRETMVVPFIAKVKVPGGATSLKKPVWEQARVYPEGTSALLQLSGDQREALRRFASP